VLIPARSLRCLLCAFAVIATLGTFIPTAKPLFAQSARLELGRRLQRFEKAWESAAPEQRVAAVSPLKVAVNSFFSLRLAEAGRQLDNAWLAVRGPAAPPSALEQAVIGLQLLPTPVCADVLHAGLRIQLTPFYETTAQPPSAASLLLAIHDASGKVLAETSIPLSEAVLGADWATPALPAGDHTLKARIRDDSGEFALPECIVSRIPEFSSRLEQLQTLSKSAAAPPEDVRQAVIVATSRSTAATAAALQQGRLQETDYPILERINLCEKLNAESPAADLLLQHSRSRDLWLTLARGNKAVPTRIRGPRESSGPLPVLFVFHGAGGSENMFFETYGAGRTIREAVNRGWLVVAPGQGLLGLSLDVPDLLNALEPWFPIDRTRVMLLGHSMGAAQVIRQMQRHPDTSMAAVALGGGGRFSARQLPTAAWFVAAGEEDFGRSGARQLHQSLVSSGIPSLWREYPDVEHLAIVQAAIPEVFQFLDETLAKR
jgi:predicted esterase